MTNGNNPSSIQRISLLLSLTYPIAIVIGIYFFFELLIPCKIQGFEITRGPTSDAAQIRALYFWGASVVAVITACTWMMAVGFCVLWPSTDDVWRKAILAGTALAVAIGAIYLLLPPYQLDNCVTRIMLLKGLEDTLSGDPPETLNVTVVQTLAAVQAFGLGASVVLAVAACSVLLHKNDSSNDEAQHLAETSRTVRFLLYLGAIALVTVNISFGMLFEIGESRIPHTIETEVAGVTMTKTHSELIRYRDLASGLKVYWGSTLTLLLIAIFILPFLVVSRRARALAKRDNPNWTEKQVRTWLEERGLIDSWQTQLTKTFAMLAPALTGSLSSALSQVPLL